MYAAGEKIIPREIEEEVKDSYLSYAMSVIVGRALPDVRDGLKPVHRRILYAMQDLGLDPGKPYKKSARIVGECFVKDTMVLTSRGLIPIQDVERGDVVYTEGPLRRVSELYEMPAQPLLEIVLENGVRNVATLSQQFRVLTPNLEFAWKEANALTPEDHIVVRASYPTFDMPVTLQRVRPTDPDRLNEALAYLLGFWLSDGWIEKERGWVGWYSNTRPIIERVASTLRAQFGLEAAVEEKPYAVQTVAGLESRCGYQVRVSRDAFTQFLTVNFGIARWDAWTKEIPQALFRSPSTVIWAFVSGLLDGDGSIHAQRNAIHYGSTSSKLIEQLTLLLQHQGVFSRRFAQPADPVPRMINGRNLLTDRPFHYLEIRGSSALRAAARLRLSHPEKLARAERIAHARLKKCAYEAVPYAGAKIFGELSARHLGSGWYQGTDGEKFRQGICYPTGAKIRYANDLRSKPLRKSQISQWGIAGKLRRLGSPLSGFVDAIESNELYFLKVSAIRPTPAEVTYDIQVEGEHQFIANGMVVHNCLGKYHPHGDTAVYDALVRMVQDFSLRYPLIDGQGNFGSVDGDMAAAMRYTEARLARIAEELLTDLDKATVDFIPNFDGSLTEPRVLPSGLPNLLVNGSSGIAVGMATNIPPHNLSEVIDALLILIKDPQAEVKELMRAIQGPDFPTGGIICGRGGIVDAYQTGRGTIRTRAKVHVEQLKGGKETIIVEELPYQVNKAALIEHIAKLVQNKALEGIADLRDESDKDGMRVVIETKRDANSQIILNQLYKHTQMEATFGVIMLALVDGRPRVLSLHQILSHFLDHRKEIVIRRTRYELAKAQERAHILEGLKKALDHLDAIIKAIKQSKSPQDAKATLMKRWDFSDRQAQAILEMQLQRLTHLEREKIDQEYLELIKKIEFYQAILASERKVLEVIKDELLDLRKRFGDERRTQIIDEVQELKIEDLIADEDVVITISHAGYIKRIPVSAYRRQHRGGVGVTAMETKEEDFVEHLFIASTHEYLVFFTNQGRAYWLKVHEVPPAGRYAKGTAIINLIALQQGERLSSFVAVKAFDPDNFLVLATKQGTIKKTPLEAYANPRKAGIIAITLDKDDEVIHAHITDGKQELLLLTKQGQAIRFPEEQVREVGRSARGVRGIRLGKDDEMIGAELVREGVALLTVTSLGFGKRTKSDEYRLQSRGGKGIINVKVTKKNGDVVGTKTVTDQDDVMLITQEGMIVRCRAKDVRATGRNSQGVRLMKLHGKDRVTAVASVAHQDEEPEAAPSPESASAES